MQPAITLQALRRLGGAVPFRSSRPSSKWGYPFWLPGLTFHRSRPPSASAEFRALVPQGKPASQAVTDLSASPFSKAPSFRCWRPAGLRLHSRRQFSVFLAAGPCVASPVSYHFSSIAPPRWRFALSQFVPVVEVGLPVFAIGPNCSSQPTAFGVG